MSLSLSVLLWWNWWYPCCFAILICWICEGVVLKLLSCVGNLASLKEDDQSRSSFDSQPSCGTRQLQCCPYFLNQLLFDGMEFEHFLHLQCCVWSSSTDIREKNSSHGRPSTSRRGNWWMCQICGNLPILFVSIQEILNSIARGFYEMIKIEFINLLGLKKFNLPSI